MLKVKNPEEIKKIENPALRNYVTQKVTGMMEEYQVDNLDDIGCFVVLDRSENQMFRVSEMEFVEVLKLDEETYLHGVRILGDSYGEDVYLPIEVVKC